MAKVCNRAGCPNLVERNGAGSCPTHDPGPWAGSNRRQRLPSNWSTLRAHVLERDAHQCRCGAPATDVDHVLAGDNHDPTNLEAICARCHRAKSSAEGNAARWGRAWVG